MKYLILSILSLIAVNTYAGKYEKVNIQTSAVSDMCKDKLESTFAKVDGVVYSNLNLQNKKLLVKYDPNIIQAEQIQNIVRKAGYDADGLEADSEAYSNLNKCCKKGEKCQ